MFASSGTCWMHKDFLVYTWNCMKKKPKQIKEQIAFLHLMWFLFSSYNIFRSMKEMKQDNGIDLRGTEKIT